MTFVQSSIGGAWRKETHALPASATTTIKTIAMDNFRLLECIMVVFNDTEGKTKSVNIKVINKNNTVNDFIFGRIGYGIDLYVNAEKVGADMVLTIQNNESYSCTLRLAFVQL